MAAAPAARAADPVVAAAGDIACDPLEPIYNGGKGTAAACRTQHTLGPVPRRRRSAPCSCSATTSTTAASLREYQTSFAATWGRAARRSRGRPRQPRVRHAAAAAPPARRRRGLLRLLRGGGRRRRPGATTATISAPGTSIALNSNCSDVGGCGPARPAGQVAGGRSRGPPAAVHARLLAPSALHLGQHADARRRRLARALRRRRRRGADRARPQLRAVRAPDARRRGRRRPASGSSSSAPAARTPPFDTVDANSQVRDDAPRRAEAALHPTATTGSSSPCPAAPSPTPGAAAATGYRTVVVSQQALPRPAQVGGTTTYVVTVHNHGGSPAAGVRLSDLPPAGPASIGAITTTQGSCAPGRPVTCLLGTLAAGATATVRIAVRTPVVGTIANGDRRHRHARRREHGERHLRAVDPGRSRPGTAAPWRARPATTSSSAPS